MIQNIAITKLFGRFDYNIDFKSSGITIITGPNGFGKSTILKIVEAASKANFFYFWNLNFAEIVFQFEDLTQFAIEKNEKTLIVNKVEFDPKDSEFIESSYRRFPWMRRINEDTWLDMRTDELILEDEVFLRSLSSTDIERYLSVKDAKKWRKINEVLSTLSKKCGEIRLISEQRLIRKEQRRRGDEEQLIDVIRELPERLKKEISAVDTEYSMVANKLDGSYPNRLFSATEGLAGKEEYQACLTEASKKFQKLNLYNLVNMSFLKDENYNNKYSTALKIYFDDFFEKYKVFESLIEKLDLFTKIINERLTFKEIRISKEHGFEVIDVSAPDKILSLNQLSSGEKQEIVLFYELIFDTKSNLLLLIDEPELSLHIAWQKHFLNDLLAVSQNTEIKAVVATHSPQIISNHWEIQIDLGELYGKQ